VRDAGASGVGVSWWRVGRRVGVARFMNIYMGRFGVKHTISKLQTTRGEQQPYRCVTLYVC
jgi:hypothetical protein